MKTHWLYGFGPKKEVKFNIEIDVETKCSDCLHREVCIIDMERRCSNYEFGRSDKKGCESCNHTFTRYDKDNIPCFHCKWHKENK